MCHLKFAENLSSMGFTPCKADQNLWMHDREDHWEYVVVMVEDLLVFSREADIIIEPIK